MLGIDPRTLSLLSSHLTIELYRSTYESILKKNDSIPLLLK